MKGHAKGGGGRARGRASLHLYLSFSPFKSLSLQAWVVSDFPGFKSEVCHANLERGQSGDRIESVRAKPTAIKHGWTAARRGGHTLLRIPLTLEVSPGSCFLQGTDVAL